LKDKFLVKENLHIYIRVSSDIQSNDGFGLENQKQKGIEISKKLKMKPIIINEGSSSSKGSDDKTTEENITDRKKLKQLLLDIEDGLVNNLWVYQMDRLSRNEDVSNYIKKVIRTNNVKLFVDNGVFDLNNPNDSLMFKLLDSFSTFDNQIRTERLRRGKLSKVKGGGWKGGSTPFGFENVDGKLSPHKIERRWVKKIYEWYLDGTSIYEIKKLLQNNGVLSRRGLVIWNTNSITNILDNNQCWYEGYSTYTDKSLDETVTTYNPPILSSTLVKKVRDKLSLRVKKSNYEKRVTVLKDFLVCFHCSNKFGVRINKTQYHNHYYCRGNMIGIKSNPIGSEKVCKIENGRVRSLNIEDTDVLVWNMVLDVLNKSHLYKEMFKTKTDNVIPTKKERDNLTQNLRRRSKLIDKQIKEVDDSRNSFIVNNSNILNLSNKELKVLLLKYEERKSELMIQREGVLNEIESTKITNVWVDWVKKFGDEIDDLRNREMSDEDRNTFLNGVVDKIIIKTEDSKTHLIDIHFKKSFVNDGFKWNFKKVRGKDVKDGYKLIDGKKNIIGKYNYIRTKKKNINSIV
jgi:DNA invertase Pin-like site-specific DNA recombinase